MGTIKKGILGGFSGTVGTVVGASWRGMDVMRSRPKSSGSNPTPLQILQRQKFALAIKFQNSLRAMQNRLYGENSGVKSRVNLAAAYLLKEVVAEENGNVFLQMEKVLITKGDLTGFQNVTAAATSGEKISFTWEDNSSQMRANADDLFCTAVYEAESGKFRVQEGPELRSEGSASVTLPAEWNGKTVYVFAFFQNSAQDKACNSVYLNTLTVV